MNTANTGPIELLYMLCNVYWLRASILFDFRCMATIELAIMYHQIV